MSLDISLKVLVETIVADKNITHNLSVMWKEAGIYDALYNSEGQTAETVLPTLESGLGLMKSDPEKFKKHNPANGWGNYEGAIQWLSELISEFKEYPNGIIEVSK